MHSTDRERLAILQLISLGLIIFMMFIMYLFQDYLRFTFQYFSNLQKSTIANNQSGDAVTLTGKLSIYHTEGEGSRSSKTEYLISPTEGGSELQKVVFSQPQSLELESGAVVKVAGKLVAQDIVLVDNAADPNSVEIKAGAPKQGHGELSLLVVLLRSTGFDPYGLRDQSKYVFPTRQEVTDLVFGSQTDTSVAVMLSQASAGKLALRGKVTSWIETPLFVDSCNLKSVAELVKKEAARQGIDVASFSHVMVMGHTGCERQATIGKDPTDSFDQSISIIGLPQAGNSGPALHAIGHMAGLGHAQTYNCESERIHNPDCIGDSADPFDPMGKGNRFELNLLHRLYMGWLSDLSVVKVEKSGQYSLAPLSQSGLATKGLYIAGGKAEAMYIEYQTEGREGALLYVGNNLQSSSLLRIDSSENEDEQARYVLTPGQSYHNSQSGITITVKELTPQELILDIETP